MRWEGGWSAGQRVRHQLERTTTKVDGKPGGNALPAPPPRAPTPPKPAPLLQFVLQKDQSPPLPHHPLYSPADAAAAAAACAVAAVAVAIACWHDAGALLSAWADAAAADADRAAADAAAAAEEDVSVGHGTDWAAASGAVPASTASAATMAWERRMVKCVGVWIGCVLRVEDKEKG